MSSTELDWQAYLFGLPDWKRPKSARALKKRARKAAQQEAGCDAAEAASAAGLAHGEGELGAKVGVNTVEARK